jgi:hypothetical protein
MRSIITSVMRTHIHQLDASVGAPGPHGFTVRKTSFVRIQKRMLRNLAATAARLHVRDDRETPLYMRRDARQMKLIWQKEKAGYFSRAGWTGRIGLMRLAKLGSASKAICGVGPLEGICGDAMPRIGRAVVAQTSQAADRALHRSTLSDSLRRLITTVENAMQLKDVP